MNVANKDPESYDIEDMGSDESTDDDEAPKKQIPKWATGRRATICVNIVVAIPKLANYIA